MAIKEKTMVRAAAMQYDRDHNMSVGEIAEKYHVSRTIVYQYTHSTKPTLNSADKASRHRDFASQWNEVRYAILLGLRIAWIDEWNEVRFRLLGRRVEA